MMAKDKKIRICENLNPTSNYSNEKKNTIAVVDLFNLPKDLKYIRPSFKRHNTNDHSIPLKSSSKNLVRFHLFHVTQGNIKTTEV